MINNQRVFGKGKDSFKFSINPKQQKVIPTNETKAGNETEMTEANLCIP
jgi:hypothetical protein